METRAQRVTDARAPISSRRHGTRSKGRKEATAGRRRRRKCVPCSPIVKAAPVLACAHPLGAIDGGTFTVMGRLAGLLPSRTPPRSSATIATAQSAVFDLSGQGKTEFCFFEYGFYEQRVHVFHSAVLFSKRNRSGVRASSTYRSASASVGSLNRVYSTVGSPVSANIGLPNRANRTVGLPARAGLSARAVSAASTVSAPSAISVLAASAKLTQPAAKDGGSTQGAGSLVNAAATPTAS